MASKSVSKVVNFIPAVYSDEDVADGGHMQVAAHAVTRMAQRGINESDVRLIMSLGTEVEGGYLARDKDFARFEHLLKQLRNNVRRLVGKRIVMKNGALITAYHPTKPEEQRIMRNSGSLCSA